MDVVTDEDFTHLVNQHHAEIYRYLARITGRISDADDLSQETFLRAFRACVSGGPNGDPRAWLFTIATNLTKNHFRAQKRRRRAQDELVRGAASVPDHTEGEGPGRELGEAADRIVAKLPLNNLQASHTHQRHDSGIEPTAYNPTD